MSEDSGPRIEAAVRLWLGERRICGRCTATLTSFPAACQLPGPCPGFRTIEGAAADAITQLRAGLLPSRRR